jgi:hypothetical protein
MSGANESERESSAEPVAVTPALRSAWPFAPVRRQLSDRKSLGLFAITLLGFVPVAVAQAPEAPFASLGWALVGTLAFAVASWRMGTSLSVRRAKLWPHVEPEDGLEQDGAPVLTRFAASDVVTTRRRGRANLLVVPLIANEPGAAPVSIGARLEGGGLAIRLLSPETHVLAPQASSPLSWQWELARAPGECGPKRLTLTLWSSTPADEGESHRTRVLKTIRRVVYVRPSVREELGWLVRWFAR